MAVKKVDNNIKRVIFPSYKTKKLLLRCSSETALTLSEIAQMRSRSPTCLLKGGTVVYNGLVWPSRQIRLAKFLLKGGTTGEHLSNRILTDI